jgi:hypothetical protein
VQVSFLMDREKPGVTKSQPGFVDFVVRPLFDTWVACFPDCKVRALLWVPSSAGNTGDGLVAASRGRCLCGARLGSRPCGRGSNRAA